MKAIFILVICLWLLSCHTAPPQFNANTAVSAPVDGSKIPSPALVIRLTEPGKISILDGEKTEEVGTVDDTTRLSVRAREILSRKEDKTVFVRSPRSMRYGNVVKVIDAMKVLGAAPIGLQMDDLEDEK